MTERRTLHGWSIRWDAVRAAKARADQWWADETMAEVSARLALAAPDRVLVIDAVRRLDAATLRAEADSLAQAFLRRGLKPGDVISFMLPNWHEAAVIYLAATLTGLVAHPIVPALRDRELSFMLRDASSRIIFIPAQFRGCDYPAMLARVSGTLVNPPEIVVLRGGAGGAIAYANLLAESGQTLPLALPVVDPDSVKLVLYTSGTTGRPKGVLHSHNSIHALVRQLQREWHTTETSCFFVPAPISHIGGSIYAFEMPILFGATAILQDQWDPDSAVALIEAERCTHMAGAPLFLEQLLAAAARAGTRLPSLEMVICGGASVPPSLIRRAADYFQGCIVTRVFGSTEVPLITVGSLTPGDIEHAVDTDGRIGIADVKLVDMRGRTGGDEGEVCARGPQMLVGYLWIEDERDAFDEDGYFHMGDVARRCDGDYLVVTDRAKDIIIRQGENIAPREIEDLLILHPDIAEVAIVGLPDPCTGERACAAIVPRGLAQPDVAELKAFLEDRNVARFKIPEAVVIRKSLPRNAAGKIMKHKIRESILADMSRKG
jgi:acyl-CoA synthetase (AMP-forming)/AMP-acid ligase II